MDEPVGFLGERLISIISKLQEILHGANLPEEDTIHLPEVVVVGSQSSGKSSVLESLVGKDFLPRGPDICTRRPLVLSLRQTQLEKKEIADEWAEFPTHLPGKVFTDFAAVRDEIDAETTRLLGSATKDISSKPIHLTIYSPNVLTMSLVDLPGMTRVPVKGQPEDISARLESLIKLYISNPASIILAVSAANGDLANSDAIALARTADPSGRRTIGVLTKLDIMDRGTDALRMLRNEIFPLRLGYVAVVNRAQADVQSGMAVAQARANEASFFASSPAYRRVPERCGIPALGRRIQSILVQHIKQRLPDLRNTVEALERRRREELAALGTAPSAATEEDARAALLRLVSEYAACFSDALHGRPRHTAGVPCLLHGGARIRHVFHDIFGTVLDELDPCAGLSDDQIWAVLNNCAGVHKPLVVAKEAFEALVRKTLRQLQNPSLQCLEMVAKELLRITEESVPEEISRFPFLLEQLEQLVSAFVSDAARQAEGVLASLFECELAYINVEHPAFLGLKAAWEELFEKRGEGEVSSGGEEGDSGQEREGRISNGAAAQRARARSSGAQPRHHAALMLGADSRSGSQGSLAYDEQSTQQRDGSDAPDQPGWLSSFFVARKMQEGRTPAAYSLPSSAQGNRGGSLAPGPGEGFASVLQAAPVGPTGTPRAHNGPLLPSAPSHIVSRVVSQQDQDSVEVTRKLVRSYFFIVRGTMKDLVPKVVMRFVVLSMESQLHGYLITSLLSGQERDLMQERPEVARRRKVLADTVAVLNKALKQLQLIPRELETCSADLPVEDVELLGVRGQSESDRVGAPDAGTLAVRSMKMYHSLAMSSMDASSLTDPSKLALAEPLHQ